jgi:hyperosmotically inducible protein
VKGSDISVTTTEGVVALTGTVSTAKEKSNAEKIAKAVKGVKSVDASGLTVSAAAK